jgi:hypothetical protein
MEGMLPILGTEGPRTVFTMTLLPNAARSIQDFSLFENERVLLPMNMEFAFLIVATNVLEVQRGPQLNVGSFVMLLSLKPSMC